MEKIIQINYHKEIWGLYSTGNPLQRAEQLYLDGTLYFRKEYRVKTNFRSYLT